MPQNRWGHTVLRLVDVDILRDTANIYITMLNKILEDVHMYLLKWYLFSSHASRWQEAWTPHAIKD